MERGHSVGEDRGWELFSESEDALSLAWTEFTIVSLQALKEPDPGKPGDPAPCWNTWDSPSGRGSPVSWKELGPRQ